MTLIPAPPPNRTNYEWLRDIGPIAVAVVATGIALLSYRESITQERQERQDSLIDARNLACLSTRFVSPYLHESLAAGRFVDKALVFDAIIYSLKAIDFQKIHPLKLSDQFVDIYRITSQASKWSDAETVIPKASTLESDIFNSRATLNSDIDTINKFIEEKYPDTDDSDLVKCRNVDDIVN